MNKENYALNFDLFQEKLKENGFDEPLKAYGAMYKCLSLLGYSKRQQSSVLADEKKDIALDFDNIERISKLLNWLPECVNHFTATAESGVLDLKPYLSEELSKEDFINLENEKVIANTDKRAIHFDLSIKEIDKNFEYRSKPYYLINKEMKKQGFEHQQGSGYISKEALNSEEFIDKIYAICENIPKLKETLKHIDATYLQDVYDITPFIREMLEDNFTYKMTDYSSLQKDVINFTRDKLSKEEIINKSFKFKDNQFYIKDIIKESGQNRADAIIEDCETHNLFLEKNFAGSNPFKLNLNQKVKMTSFVNFSSQQNTHQQ